MAVLIRLYPPTTGLAEVRSRIVCTVMPCRELSFRYEYSVSVPTAIGTGA